MANFPNMEQIGAEINSRLTTLETNSASYLTKTTADASYLGINSKATSASKADSATKATQDGSGNNIVNTYGTKTEVNQRILATGDRGSLAGYETLTSSSSAVTISDNSPDDTAISGAVAISISNGTSGKVWSKSVGITNAGATISLGSAWCWMDGKIPTVAANSVLILKWYGSFGVACLILTS